MRPVLKRNLIGSDAAAPPADPYPQDDYPREEYPSRAPAYPPQTPVYPPQGPARQPQYRQPEPYGGYGGGGGYRGYPQQQYPPQYPPQPQYIQPPQPTGNPVADMIAYDMYKRQLEADEKKKSEAKPTVISPQAAPKATSPAEDMVKMANGLKEQANALSGAMDVLKEFSGENPIIAGMNTPFAGGIGQMVGQIGVMFMGSFLEERKMRRLESTLMRYEKAAEAAAKTGKPIPAEVQAQVQQVLGGQPQGGPGVSVQGMPGMEGQMPNGGMPFQQQQQPGQPVMVPQVLQQGYILPQEQSGMPPGEFPTHQTGGQAPPPNQMPSGMYPQGNYPQQNPNMQGGAGGAGSAGTIAFEPHDRQLMDAFTQRTQLMEQQMNALNARLDSVLGSGSQAGPGGGVAQARKPARQSVISCPFCNASVRIGTEECPECGESLKGEEDDGWGGETGQN